MQMALVCTTIVKRNDPLSPVGRGSTLVGQDVRLWLGPCDAPKLY